MRIDPTQRADAVTVGPRRRPVEDALLKRLMLHRRQQVRPATVRLGRKPIKPAITVGVAPTLDKATRSVDALCNLQRGQAVDR